MQHPWARQTISRVLAGSGFGAQALAVALAADLQERVPQALADALMDSAQALTPEPATPYAGPHNQAAIPSSAADLIAQLAPVTVANPGDTGLNLGLLMVLAELWPHVSSEERPVLRVRFLNGLMERAGAVGTRAGVARESVVTTAELKVWNRYMPTSTGGGGSAAELPKLLTAGTGQEAYHQLADHLIGGMQPATLARILGTLAVRLIDSREDRHGDLLHPLVGAIAAERLAQYAPPDSFTTLLSQLAHQIWWSANRAGLAKRTGSEVPIDDLNSAIANGSAASARRKARTLHLDEAGWWSTLSPAFISLTGRDPDRVRRAIAGAWTLAARSANRVVAPDDAAGVVALLADGA